LAPWKNVSNKGRYYSQEEEDNSNISGFLIKIRAVVKASANVEVDTDEEKRSAVGVHVPDKSAISDISTNMRYR